MGIVLVLITVQVAVQSGYNNLGIAHASSSSSSSSYFDSTAADPMNISDNGSSSSKRRRRSVRNVHPQGFSSLMKSNLEQSLKTPVYTTTTVTVPQSSSSSSSSIGNNDHDGNGIRRNKRNLQQNSKTQDIRIKFVTEPLEQLVAQSEDPNTKLRGAAILNIILPQLAYNFANSLKVTQTETIAVPPDACFGYFSDYVDSSMVDPGVVNKDIVVFISAFDTLGSMKICNADPSLSTLAVSSPCNVDSNDRPVIGFANICLNSLRIADDFSGVDQNSLLVMEDVLTHEFIHILGMNSSLFKYFRSAYDNSPLTTRQSGGGFFNKNWFFNQRRFTCVNGRPDQVMDEISESTVVYKNELVQMSRNSPEVESSRGYYEIVLPTVAQVVRNHFDCQTLQGARLENQPTSTTDCMGSHFDERFFFTDIMSALYDENGAYFSPLTLAFLEDTGWYISNFERAENNPFGIAKGCGFVEQSCIIDGKVPSHSEGFFCNNLQIESKTQCGPSHNYRGECDLTLSQFPQRDYFGNTAGPIFTHADWCPIVRSDITDCDNEAAVKIDDIEVFHPESRCMNVELKGGVKTAVCIRATCDAPTKTLQFNMGWDKYNCTVADAGQQKFVVFDGRGYKFDCPPLQHICPQLFCPAMCSGKGQCDWDTGTCKCFDPKDTSPGCYKSQVNKPKDPNGSMKQASPSLVAYLVAIIAGAVVAL
eukprot:CAMPEP_0203664178 /NCGR_PEP_ID=MMETSP0090-20130426/1638_1 /ASSEMBLY_ACC=CAM_ASM_001088 /TAXON_ID=426623 /ORGANISM="Chaetoceros affinis, Strain CCMP159" /LENGTH=703 /DNA_ID=CAMNT_0050527327 /DNA_START=146 /DNA_END=2257 /DNA_ORIENTATION=+